MKKIGRFQLMALASALAIFGACNKASEPLTLGADGYGTTTLANGITVLVNQDKTTQLSAARILVGGGVLSETAADNGISNLMIRMLLKGNAAMNAAQITEQLDFLGATVSSDCFRDYTAISVTSLTENFDKVIEIISASLTSPTFPAEELAKLKTEVEGEIKAAGDNQGQASSNLFWKTVYGDEGYGLPTLGTLESIGRLTADDIKKHYEKYVGGRNMVVSVATDLPVDQISAIFRNRLGTIRPEADMAAGPTLKLQTEKSGFISFDRNQSYVFMGYVLDRLEPKDMACVILLNQVMGGNVGSRLWDLRQTEKLAYDVYTQWIAGRYATVFRSAIGTDTAKVQQALGSLNREWKRLLDEGISERELADAKVGMKNSLIFAIDRKSVRANNMAFYQHIGYGYRFILDQLAMIESITLADVNNFVKARLSDDRKFVSIVGKN